MTSSLGLPALTRTGYGGGGQSYNGGGGSGYNQGGGGGGRW